MDLSEVKGLAGSDRGMCHFRKIIRQQMGRKDRTGKTNSLTEPEKGRKGRTNSLSTLLEGILEGKCGEETWVRLWPPSSDLFSPTERQPLEGGEAFMTNSQEFIVIRRLSVLERCM